MQGGGGHDTTCKSGLQFVKKKDIASNRVRVASCLLLAVFLVGACACALFMSLLLTHTHAQVYARLACARWSGGAPNANDRARPGPSPSRVQPNPSSARRFSESLICLLAPNQPRN
jgi:hypothetical protein